MKKNINNEMINIFLLMDYTNKNIVLKIYVYIYKINK